MKSGIYRITNYKGAVYIGQSKNIDERISRYKKLQCCKNQLLLYRSFLKYGIENHIFEILERGTYTKQELNNLERKYINDNNSYRKLNKKGLNLTTGGDSIEFDISVRKKMSETRKKKILEGQYNTTKLTVEDVVKIKVYLKEGKKQVDIAKEFGVSKNMITEIKKGRTWNRVNI